MNMRWWICCMVCMWVGEAFGSVELSFPLEGYWKMGRYMPVKVEAKDAGEFVEVGGEGGVTARAMTSGGRLSAVGPGWVMGERRGSGNRPMGHGGPEERLEGCATIDV